MTARGFARNIERLIQRGGRLWILRRADRIAGFGAIAPTPGLPGLYFVDGFIARAHRRLGLASHLLRTMIDDLAGGEVLRIYHSLSSSDSSAAHFFAAQGFHKEHEELLLRLDSLADLPPARLESGFACRALPRTQAIARFRQLYDASFSGQPWYQPYETERDVAVELAEADDLLFLFHGKEPVGFLWLRWPDLDVAEIEPVGVLPAYRGRGLGRQLVLAGLNRAAESGARSATVGVWQENAAAIHLYRALGFREIGRTLFVAYDLAAPQLPLVGEIGAKL